MDSFDMHKGRWATEPDMMTGRLHFGACRVGKDILAIGGICATTFDFRNPRRRNILDSIDVRHPTDGSWQRRNVLPCGSYGFAIAIVASRIYVIGGVTTSHGQPVGPDGRDGPRAGGSVVVITEAGKIIRTSSGMPVPVSGCHAVVLGHRIVVLGGCILPEFLHGPGSHPELDAGWSEPVQELNTLTGIWTILRKLPRRHLRSDPFSFDSGLCIRAATSIRIFGGFDFFCEMSAEMITDERCQTWQVRQRSAGVFRSFKTGGAVDLCFD